MHITSTRMLGEALRQARVKRGLTQAEVGQFVGLKQPTVSALENHPDQARLRTLFRVLSALGVEIDLVPRSNDSAPRETGWTQEW